MVWVITFITFLATLSLVAALFYAFSPKEVNVAARFSHVAGIIAPVPEETHFAERQKERMRDGLASVGKILPPPSTQKASRTQLLLMRAGYRSPEATLAMRGFKILFPIGMMAAVFVSGGRTCSGLFSSGHFTDLARARPSAPPSASSPRRLGFTRDLRGSRS